MAKAARYVTLTQVRSRGMMVMTALLVAAIIFILSLSILGLIQQENRFYLEQEAQSRAYLTAQSGLWYFRSVAEKFAATPTCTGTISDPGWNQTYVIEYTPASDPIVGGDGDVWCTGTVYRIVPGAVGSPPVKLSLSRTLIVRQMDFAHVQDAGL